MGSYIKGSFRLLVVSLVRIVFDGQIKSAYFFGDEGEYEILPYHKALLGALPEGHVRILTDKEETIFIGLRAGVVLMNENNCTVIMEELDAQGLMANEAQAPK